MIRWNRVQTVLLDMDGTLLDLHYDNHFWQEHVPLRYAQRHGIDLAAARTELHQRYRRVEGTLDWYCVDYWTRELGLDIASLKEEVSHLIAVHPHVVDFLTAVRGCGKQLLLVTNAHGKALALKLRYAPIGAHFDALVCSHEVGAPKEHPAFWERFAQKHPFDRDSALFIDDSLPVLRAARAFGIGQLLAVRRPDSRRPDKDVGDFRAIGGFHEIMPR
jgi:HAD superfamily hydrolase (TIGR01509 family)